jgi:TonB-dependent SusC/RagA subfamily outer membrane receptor
MDRLEKVILPDRFPLSNHRTLLTPLFHRLIRGLQGKAAGVVVSMGSGQPGAPSSIRIRGTNSINGNNEPLYVIDGVFIVPEGNVGAVTGPSLNPLASINPSDIESVEILKDASATAIYGTRGANGVILVRTKAW